jgi:SOS-response transcriptional repressor LexA
MNIQEAWLLRFKEIVQQEIDEAGGKDSDGYRAVAAKTRLGYDYIYQIFKGKPVGKPKRPSADFMQTISRIYGLQELGESGSNIEPARGFNRARNYPLISNVQAGDWTEICDQFQPGDADEWMPSTFDLGRCGYMLRVMGKSMLDPYGKYSFPPGSILHINPDAEPVVNQFVVIRRNGENTATFKRLVELDGVRFLEAINPDWPERYIRLQAGDVFCGVVKTATLPDLP